MENKTKQNRSLANLNSDVQLYNYISLHNELTKYAAAKLNINTY